jgi:hypothetical protein
MVNGSYNFLSGFYFSGLSLGATIKGAFRFVPDYSDADDLGDAPGNPIAGSGNSQSAAMAMADIGLLTRVNFLKFYGSRDRNTTLALVARNLGPPVAGDPLPTAVAAGMSWKPLRPILLSFDFTVPLNLGDLSLSEIPYWSAGFSAEITPFLSMRAGLMAKSGNVRIALGSAVDLDRISVDINYTLDLLTQLTPLNRISLGVRFNFGDQGRKVRADTVEALYLMGLDAYAEGNMIKARRYWEAAVRRDPEFEPALEGLSLIIRSQELEERINEMQNLNF